MAQKKTPKPATEEIQNIAPAVKKATPAKIPVGCIKLRDKKQIEAAQLIIDGGMTDHQIAEQLKIGKGTIAKWKVKPQFVAYLDELKNTFRERFLKEGLAKRENRVAELSALYFKAKQVISERAAQGLPPDPTEATPDTKDKDKPSLEGVAGASTGLVVMTYKGLSKTAVEETDTSTVKMMASLLDQISVEVGDKLNKSEVKINDAVGERIERAQARARRALEQSYTPTESTAIN